MVNSNEPKINKKRIQNVFREFRVARKCLLKQLSGLSSWKFSCLFDRTKRGAVLSHSLSTDPHHHHEEHRRGGIKTLITFTCFHLFTPDRIGCDVVLFLLKA